MRVKKMFLWIFLSVTAVYCVASLFYYFFQENLLFYPEKLSENFKFNFSADFTELNYQPDKGTNLNALLFESSDKKGIVLYFHGNAGSLRSWGNLSAQFTSLNYDLLIYDYRGYGKSSGNISEKAFFSDAQFIYDELRKSYSESEIILYGRSVGTGIAAHLASYNNPKLIILETPFFSLKDIAEHYYPWLPSFILKYPFRTDRFITKIRGEVILIHGTDDEIIHYGSSLKLQKLLKEGDMLYTIKGGRHNNLASFPEYYRYLEEILK